MKFIHSILGNTFLMAVLFAMMFLPIGAMGLSSTQQGTEVLSETSVREEEAPQVRMYDPAQVNETTSSTDLGQEIDNQ